jgi:murein L,D-transpeptidase YafK
MKIALSGYFLLTLIALTAFAQDETVVIVDKKKYELHLARYKNGLEIFKTYPVTIGKNSGDKMIEGDLKTPEGIYYFTAKYVQPQIKKKFGIMAFYVDYPNLMDKKDKKTGFDIMLHSTDDPDRLARPQDSDGCIVVNDERIKEIDPFIVPQKTTLLVYEELKPEYLQANATDDVKQSFEKWLKAWSDKDLDTYIDLYAKDFRFQQMSRDQFKAYKGFLNKKYDTIQVQASDVRYYKHPKYSLVTFLQEYTSTYKGGRVAMSVKSRKRLYLVPDEGQLKILFEGN